MGTVTILLIAVRLIINSAASPMAEQVSVDKADRICSVAIMNFLLLMPSHLKPPYVLSWPANLEGGMVVAKLCRNLLEYPRTTAALHLNSPCQLWKAVPRETGVVDERALGNIILSSSGAAKAEVTCVPCCQG